MNIMIPIVNNENVRIHYGIDLLTPKATVVFAH